MKIMHALKTSVPCYLALLLLLSGTRSFLNPPPVEAQSPSSQVTVCFEFSSGDRYASRPVEVWGWSYLRDPANTNRYSWRPQYLIEVNTNQFGCAIVSVTKNNYYYFRASYRPNTQTDCAYVQSGATGWVYIRDLSSYRLRTATVARTEDCTA
jgi:hypothetical protein